MIKYKKVITILFPSFFITILMLSFFFSYGDNRIEFKSLLVISLFFIFPLLFLLQGIISSITNTNLITSIFVSILTFIIFMFICLNSSASIYIFIYLTFEIIGYILTNFIKNNKFKNNKFKNN